jgi:hypothetical protein
MKEKKVIDGDNLVLIETFNEKDTDAILEKYQNSSRWDEVDIDHDGDIILYE